MMSNFEERFGGLDNPPPLAPGQRDIQLLREGGFSNDDILAHKQRQTDMLMEGGFTAKDIDAHWGNVDPDVKPFHDWVKSNLARVPTDIHDRVTKDPLELFAAGWNMSVSGLMINGKKPDTVLPEDAGTYEKVLAGGGQLAGDLPAMIVGAVGGTLGGAAVGAPAGPIGAAAGGLVGGGAGANALPEAMRQILLGYYDRGEVRTWRDFMERVGTGTLAVGKAALVGGGSAPLGLAGGKVTGAILGKSAEGLALTGAPGVANIATQAVTAAGLQGALDGHVPDASDFASGAILALVTHGTMRAYSSLRPQEAKTAEVFTEDFQKWFSGSHAATAAGEPIRLYHGTNKSFESFSTEVLGKNTGAPSAKEGFFFTDRKATADYYASTDAALSQSSMKISKQYLDLAQDMEGLGNYDRAQYWREAARTSAFEPQLKDVYLNIKNPLVHDFGGKVFRDESYRDLIASAKASGNDGVILKNTFDAGEYNRFDAAMQGRFKSENIYVVFDPGQIKNAADAKTGFEGQARVEANLKELYRQTGITPWEATEMVKTDPTLKQELFAQNTDGQPEFEKFRQLAKPEPESYQPVTADEPMAPQNPDGLIVTQRKLQTQWADWARNPKNIVKRIDENGKVAPEPEAIAGYLQEFGKMTGMRFMVGPEEGGPMRGVGAENRQKGEAGPQHQGGAVTRWSRTGASQHQYFGVVYMPDTPDATYRAWYGLGRSEILYHEVGHGLDQFFNSKKGNFNTTAVLSPELEAEITEASQRFRPKLWELGPDHNRKPEEKMADAFAVWLSNPTERKNMPIFGKMYGKRLEPFVAAANKYLPKRTFAGWETPDGEQVKDNWYPIKDVPPPEGGSGEGAPPHTPVPPGWRGEPPERPKRIEGYDLKLSASEIAEKMNDMIGQSAPPPNSFALDKLYRDFVSELGPVRNIDKILKEKGYDIDKKMNLEDMFRQTYASGSRAGYFTRYGVLDAITLDEKNNASFIGAAKMIPKEGNIDHWRKYMLARRTIDKAAQGVETGFDVAEMGTVVREWDHLYRKATDEFNRVNRGVLEYGRDSGLFSQEGIDAMTRDNPAYVTFRRILGDREQPFTGGRGFKANSPVRRMEGDDGKIIDSILATIDNTALIVKMADRNRAIGSVVELAERHGIEPLLGLKKLPAPDVTATIAAPGSDVFKPYEIKNTKGEYDPFLAQRAVRNGGLKENQFLYLREGKPEIWEATDPQLARLLRGADSPGEANAIKKVFEVSAGLQRAGIVGDPAFPLKTGLRDQITSYILDPLHPPPFITLLRGVVPVMTENAKFKDWFAKGGAGAALASMDADYLARDMHAIMEETGTWDGMLNTVRHPYEAAQIINEKMDAMARIGYKDHAEKIGFEPLKAATAGRKAYIDFVEKGAADTINMWAKWVPFLRPTVLGHKQAGEAVVNHPLQSAAYAALSVTIPTAMLYAMNYLQDEYGGLPESRQYREQNRWMKDTMFVLPEIGGVRLRIPNPPMIGIPFGGFVNRALDFFLHNDKQAFEGWAISLLASAAPPFIPTLVTPFIETFAGRELFTHNKLVPASMEKNSGYMQYTENTTEVSKAVSRVLGKPGLDVADISPITLDNYISSWTGTLGMDVMRAIGVPFSTNGRPWEVSDIPFVQSFVVRNPRAGAYSIRNFFDAKGEADAILADKKLALSRASMGADNERELDTTLVENAARLDGIAKALRVQQSALTGVFNSPKIPTAEKRQLIDTTYSAMIKLSRAGLEIAQAVKASNVQGTTPDVPPYAPGG
jgi:hypothetical protein